MLNKITKWSLNYVCFNFILQRNISRFHCICEWDLKKKTAVTMHIICSVLSSISSLFYNVCSSFLQSSINSCLYWLFTFNWSLSVVKSHKKMFLCLEIDFVSKNFLNDAEKVNFAKKMINFLFINFKITKCLLNSALLISKTIYKYVMKMSVMLTSCFNLEKVKVINKNYNEENHLFNTILQQQCCCSFKQLEYKFLIFNLLVHFKL